MKKAEHTHSFLRKALKSCYRMLLLTYRWSEMSYLHAYRLTNVVFILGYYEISQKSITMEEEESRHVRATSSPYSNRPSASSPILLWHSLFPFAVTEVILF